MNTPVLETERLVLRKFTENDLDAVYEIFSDEEVNRFLPWFPLKTIDEAKNFMKIIINISISKGVGTTTRFARKWTMTRSAISMSA